MRLPQPAPLPFATPKRAGFVLLGLLLSGCQPIPIRHEGIEEFVSVSVFVIRPAPSGAHSATSRTARPADSSVDMIRQECPDCRIETLQLTDRFHLRQALAMVARRMTRDDPDFPPRVLISVGFGQPDRDEREQVWIEHLTRSGALLVAAVGDEGREQILFPAAYPGVAAVAGVVRRWSWQWPFRVQSKAPRSNFGSPVRLVAEVSDTVDGSRIPSELVGPDGVVAAGSSMAVPRVVGVLGRLLSFEDTPTKALDVALRSAQPVPNDPFFRAGKLGAGVIDRNAAMALSGDEWRAGWVPVRTCGYQRARRQAMIDFGLYVLGPVLLLIALIWHELRARQHALRPMAQRVSAAEQVLRLHRALPHIGDPERVAGAIQAIITERDVRRCDGRSARALAGIAEFLRRNNHSGCFDGVLARLREPAGR